MRIVVNTHKTTTITLAAHVCLGLIPFLSQVSGWPQKNFYIWRRWLSVKQCKQSPSTPMECCSELRDVKKFSSHVSSLSSEQVGTSFSFITILCGKTSCLIQHWNMTNKFVQFSAKGFLESNPSNRSSSLCARGAMHKLWTTALWKHLQMASYFAVIWDFPHEIWSARVHTVIDCFWAISRTATFCSSVRAWWLVRVEAISYVL